MSYSVYLHTFPNGKYYVGITKQDVEKRWCNGLGYTEKHQPLMWRAIKKYGWNNIKHEVLHTELSEHDAKKLEQYYINLYHSNNKDYGYNRTNGGDGMLGFRHSEESKRQISQSLKKAWGNDDLKKRMSIMHSGKNNGNYGKTLSEEQRAIISAYAKTRVGDKNPFYGKKHSKESIEKMKEAHKMQVGSKNGKSKPVVCIETGETFESASLAAKNYNVSPSNITSACRGDSHSAIGYHWKYIE